jgi:diguanylate cyclase (GGDEF)-like protein
MPNGSKARRQFASSRWLLSFGFAVTAGFAALCGAVLIEMHGRDYEHAKQASSNLVASVASDIDRNIELYDLSLQEVVDGLKLPGLDRLSSDMRSAVLFDRATTGKDLGPILVLDCIGNVTIDSQSAHPQPMNYSDRDFFRAHVGTQDAGLFVSRPWIGPDGQYLISLSRRIIGADGKFDGVVVGSMRVSYFDNLARRFKLGSGDSIMLLRGDGVIMVRAPHEASVIGTDFSGSSIFAHYPAVRSGSFDVTSRLDGVDRLVVFQQVGDRPLLITGGTALKNVFAGWWHDLTIIGSLVLALCAITMTLFVFLARTLRQCADAERRLATIASTDALTGLSNRRRFDEALEAEWRKAERQNSPISLIMVDADHFKAYNDAHGHQAGDAALASIARCIAEGPRHKADIAARYGGEEFAVLLPHHTLEGALAVAEEIRASVLALRAQQQGRPDATPTISAGIAAMIPMPGLTPQDLVKSADLALYEAKRQGRDCAVPASAVGATLDRGLQLAA